MQTKTRLECLKELRNDHQMQTLEAEAKVRAMGKQPQDQIVKAVMNPATMQMQNVTVGQLLKQAKEELVRREVTLKEYDLMIEEETAPKKQNDSTGKN